MSGLDIVKYIFKTRNYFYFNSILVLFLCLSAIGTSSADSISDIHNSLDEKLGDSECLRCHTSHDITGKQTLPLNTVKEIKTPQSLQSLPTAQVIGDITLITSMGQNWYQQGINGLGPKTWGWTFFDEIYDNGGYPSGRIMPSEQITQRNNIYALLLDSGNNSTPINGALVSANITYWLYDGSNYTSRTTRVDLTEDTNHSGSYSGNFYFKGGPIKNEYSCSYCHLMHGQNTPQLGYFPGNYSAVITAQSENKISTKEISFEVTPWGCEDCHGTPNSHKSPSALSGEACYTCHSLSGIGHADAENPHQNIAHRSTDCTKCHTNKTLSSQTFTKVTFGPGGINGSRSVPLYNNTPIQLNGGTHSNLTCKYCHKDLALPIQQGGYNQDNYTIKNTVNNYTPSFTSIQQFQDNYVINVTSGEPLNLSLDWEGTSNIGFFLFPPGFIPNKTNKPYYNGSNFTNKPETYRNSTPSQGDWILVVYGYDFIAGLKIGELQTALNYTLYSTYPISQKKLPQIPECNSCHNSNGEGKAYTTDDIPDWNPGFAHVDTNNDGTLDIQCRMCHDAMHEITVKDCHNCHFVASVNHPIQEPDFSNYTPAQCLNCHGDPHKVTSVGGTDCIACHSPKDVNISKFARHADINTSDGDGNVTNYDCWTCHYQKDMDRSHVYLCESCHSNSGGIVEVKDPSLIKSGFTHGMTTCKACHAPSSYHQKGTVGPLGAVENILRKMLG
jgi:hypothetical protein